MPINVAHLRMAYIKGLVASYTRREKKAGYNRPCWSLYTAFFDETMYNAVNKPFILLFYKQFQPFYYP